MERKAGASRGMMERKRERHGSKSEEVVNFCLFAAGSRGLEPDEEELSELEEVELSDETSELEELDRESAELLSSIQLRTRKK